MKKTTSPSPLVVAGIQDARARSPLLKVELYCGHPECSIREIQITVKDHEQDFVTIISRQHMRCPVCGRPAKVHEVQTFEEAEHARETFARMSVNAQMWRRDWHRDNGPGLMFTSLARLCDARLPPTPDGWFEPSKQAKPA